MTSLIACVSTGKGTWGPVAKLINSEEWDTVFLVTNEFSKEKFAPNKPVNYLCVNPNNSISQIRDEIVKTLSEKINDTEVALNLISGTGKEHMAVISAVLKLGLGIRFVVASESGIEEL